MMSPGASKSSSHRNVALGHRQQLHPAYVFGGSLQGTECGGLMSLDRRVVVSELKLA
jgi:hypothetical protein